MLLPSFAPVAEVSALAKLSRITRLFTSVALHKNALEVAGAIGLSHDRVYILGSSTLGKQSFSMKVNSTQSRGQRMDTKPVKEDTLAYMVFSSGTSGLPKGAFIMTRK